VKPNNRQEFAVLLHYLEKFLGSTSFSASYPDDDTGSDFEALQLTSSKKLGRQAIGPGSGCPVIPYNRNNVGVLSLWNFHCGAGYSPLVTSDVYPLIIRGDSVSSSAAAFQLASTNSKNIYANFYMPLHTDLQDPFIEFFTNVFKEFVPDLDFSLEIQVNNQTKSVFNYVSQQMYEGANSAYVISQAIAALGNQPTRTGLIAFLRGNSKSLSSAALSPVDYSVNSNVGNTIQYIAKYDGARWVKVSDYYRVSPDGTSIQTALPQRNPLLQGGLPSATLSGQSIVEITCKKGKLTQKVKGTNAKCPKGFKKVKL
jgi:hypothetical protein